VGFEPTISAGEWPQTYALYCYWDRLNNLYFSPNIIRVINSRRMSWAEHVARMGDRRDAYRVLVGKTEEKKSLGRPRSRWENNIKMDF